MKKTIFFFMIAAISCTNRKDDVICTMEYRTINIKVNNATLQDFYTIRESTGDTISYTSGYQPDQNFYPVLTDNYQPMIANQTENFRFVGIISDTIAVDEIFSIKADQCHIQYVSGNQEVSL